MSYARSELAKRSQFASLHELFLLFAQLLLATLNFHSRILQITHDMDHGFASGLKAKVGLVKVLQDMHHGSSGIGALSLLLLHFVCLLAELSVGRAQRF